MQLNSLMCGLYFNKQKQPLEEKLIEASMKYFNHSPVF